MKLVKQLQQNWSYLVIEVARFHLEDVLNQHGMAGWELVSVQGTFQVGHTVVTLILKRPV